MKKTIASKKIEYPLIAAPRAIAVPATYSIEFNLYLKEIREYNVLRREEMNELARKYQQEGDIAAGRSLILANLRLVVKIATDFQFYWRNNLLDLIQEGNIGLIRAVKMFDPYRGVKFSYYASYWIKAYILKFIMDNWRLVKITTTEAMRALFFKLNQEKMKIAALGLSDENAILAQRLHVKEQDIEEMTKRLNGTELSLDMPAGENSGRSLGDQMASKTPAPEDLAGNREVEHKVRTILDREKQKFSLRERIILEQRLLADSPKTLQQLAERFQISRERTRQIEAVLLNKIRTLFAKQLPDYVAEFASH